VGVAVLAVTWSPILGGSVFLRAFSGHMPVLLAPKTSSSLSKLCLFFLSEFSKADERLSSIYVHRIRVPLSLVIYSEVVRKGFLF